MLRYHYQANKWTAFIKRFSNHWPPKALYNIASHWTFTHTFTHQRRSRPCKATASSSGAIRVSCFAQGHLNTQLRGAGHLTSNLQVTSHFYLLSYCRPNTQAGLSVMTCLYSALSLSGQYSGRPQCNDLSIWCVSNVNLCYYLHFLCFVYFFLIRTVLANAGELSVTSHIYAAIAQLSSFRMVSYGGYGSATAGVFPVSVLQSCSIMWLPV